MEEHNNTGQISGGNAPELAPGNSITHEEAPGNEPATIHSETRPSRTPSSRRTLIIILAIVGVLLLAGLITWLVLRQRPANNQTNNSGNSAEQNPSGGNSPIGQPDASGKYTGSGYAVAVFDNGFNKNHEALQGKVIEEICVGFIGPYTDVYGNQPESLCPEGAELVAQKGNVGIYRGAGVASDCTPRLPNTEENKMFQNCMHGTAMAGVVAMDPRTITTPEGPLAISGTAPGAKLILVQVYSYIPPSGRTGADIYPDAELAIPALEYLADNVASFGLPIASVNFSIGVEEYSAASDAACRTLVESVPSIAWQYEGYKQAFARLNNLDIATVVANGNAGVSIRPSQQVQRNVVEFPACVDGAVAVGAVDDTLRNLSIFSENGPNTSLLAPGGDGSQNTLKSVWVPAGNSTTEYLGVAGTSEAAPYVAGGFATLRQKFPQASVSQLLQLFQETGVPVNDAREGFNVGPKPLIQIEAALERGL